jgi:hypothetical protein
VIIFTYYVVIRNSTTGNREREGRCYERKKDKKKQRIESKDLKKKTQTGRENNSKKEK